MLRPGCLFLYMPTPPTPSPIRDEYLLTGEGIVRRTTSDTVVAPLSALAARIPPGFINTAFEYQGVPVHLLHSEKALTYAFEMKKLPFSTYFEPTLAFREMPILVPVFQKTEKAEATSCVWEVPESCRLFHVVYVTLTKGANHALSYNGYLVAMSTDRRDKTCWRLPLTNVFEDGRLCYGNDGLPRLENKLLPGVLANMLHVRLLESNWNTDLLRTNGGDLSRTQKVFQFDPKSLLSVNEAAQAWRDGSSSISNEVFTNVLIHI